MFACFSNVGLKNYHVGNSIFKQEYASSYQCYRLYLSYERINYLHDVASFVSDQGNLVIMHDRGLVINLTAHAMSY